jgi:hypothetical protein
MSKRALAAAALVSVTALTAATATAVPGTAATERQQETTRVVLTELASHQLGQNTFAGADRVKSDGRLVGFGNYTGRFHPSDGSVTVNVSLALRGGIIVIRVADVVETSERFEGSIVTGSGKYRDVDGTVRGRFVSGTQGEKVVLNLRYTY